MFLVKLETCLSLTLLARETVCSSNGCILYGSDGLMLPFSTEFQ